MNERQEYVLYKARMEFEQAREAQHKHCDKIDQSKSSIKSWGEKLDKLNNKLATEAVEYIAVLQEAFDRRGDEIEKLKEQLQNRNNLDSIKETPMPVDSISRTPPGTKWSYNR